MGRPPRRENYPTRVSRYNPASHNYHIGFSMKHQDTNTSAFRQLLVLAAIAFSLGLAGTSMAAGHDDDDTEDDDGTAAVAGMHMAFVAPEICATLYPELRPAANEYRRQMGEQMAKGMPAGAKKPDLTVPEEENKKMMQCIDKKATMSKNQCQQLISHLTSGMAGKKPTASPQEMEQLNKASNAMMAPCIKNQVEATKARQGRKAPAR